MTGKARAMRIVLHIGFHKTGSSAVQEYLNAFRNFNLSQGLFYPPPLSGTPSHGEVPWALLGARARWRTGDFDLADVWAHHLEAALRCQSASGAHTTLISSEDFSLLSDTPAHMQHLADALRGRDVWVVASLRAPLDYLVSWYGHAIRTGKTRAGAEELGRIAPWKSLDYPGRLAPWAAHFGADRLIVLPYRRDAVRAYARALGVAVSPDYQQAKVNAPPHPWVIDAYRMLPQQPAFDAARQHLLALSRLAPKVDPVRALDIRPEVRHRARHYREGLKRALELYPRRALPSPT